MPINLRNLSHVDKYEFPVNEEKDCKAVLDDISAFLMLCPVSELTGHRQNPLDALNMVLSPDKARIVNEVLQDIPVSGVPSHDAMFDILEQRLESGTDAERALFRSRLEKYADTLFSIRPDLKDVGNENIKFGDNDSEIKDS